MSQVASAQTVTTLQCAHCGLTIDPTIFSTEQAQRFIGQVNDRPSFCCHGCMGAYALIHELGLESFYDLRDATAHEPGSPIQGRSSVELLQDLDAAGVNVVRDEQGLCAVRLSIDGLHCAACSWLIESMPSTLPGFQSARVRMSDHSLELVYDPERTSPASIARRLAKLGYGLSPYVDEEKESSEDKRLQREQWIGIAVAFFLAANAMWIGISLYAGESTGISYGNEQFLRWTGALLGLLAAIFPGRVFFRSAWQALRSRKSHIDIPIALALTVGTIGSVTGAVMGHGHIYFDSLASLILLLRIGRYVQFRSQYRTSLSIGRLLRIHSLVANRIQPDGSRQLVPANRLKIGDDIEILPGQTIPADGNVISGSSMIQTALLTGESRPRSVGAGDALIGGCLNVRSPIVLRVSAIGEQSRVGRMMELVKQATCDRTPLVQKADQVGGWFVLLVLMLSVLTWIGWFAISGVVNATQNAIALLTIACPCALAIAAPMVITVALGRAAKKSIWIRDGNCLEKLSKPGTIWFDKTGTLTLGELRVERWSGTEEDLARVVAIERQTQHPIASAIVLFAGKRHSDETIEVHSIEQVDGYGVIGTVGSNRMVIGNEALMEREGIPTTDSRWSQSNASDTDALSTVWVARDGAIVGSFSIGDQLRMDAVSVLKQLQVRGWKIGLLSGDAQSAVSRTTNQLRKSGVTFIGELGGMCPEAKQGWIRQCLNDGERPVVMVGDGVNDAAALATADVGIAVRGNGDIALRNAPVYIPNNQLESLLDLVDSSRIAVNAIYRCFAASLIYNAVTISLAIAGLIHPLIAAILMPISGLTVLTIALSARIFRSMGHVSKADRINS